MPVREFLSPDGRQWRVWAVHPNAMIGDRRQLDRRVTPVESLADPPVLERRHPGDRRVVDGARPRSRPGELLPNQWREGWLVYEEVPEAQGTEAETRETRRLAPIPPQWESATETELAEQLRRASPGRRPTGA